MAAVTMESRFRVSGVTRVDQMGDIQVYALRGVDLKWYPGEFVVILGASGRVVLHLDPIAGVGELIPFPLAAFRILADNQ